MDWSSFGHAFGKASDVPALLKAAVSAVEEDREFAFRLLSETVIHQGVVYEASPAVVPFLCQMLVSPQSPDKPLLAMLLAELARGHSTHSWAEATRTAVGQHLPLLFPYLQDRTRRDSASIRASVAAALALFPVYAATTLPVLREAGATETDRRVVQSIDQASMALTHVG